MCPNQSDILSLALTLPCTIVAPLHTMLQYSHSHTALDVTLSHRIGPTMLQKVALMSLTLTRTLTLTLILTLTLTLTLILILILILTLSGVLNICHFTKWIRPDFPSQTAESIENEWFVRVSALFTNCKESTWQRPWRRRGAYNLHKRRPMTSLTGARQAGLV